MLLSGIVAAIITSPIFDRVLTHHLGLAVRILCPIIAAAWLSLIWAGEKVLLPFSLSSLSLAILITVRPHNDAALFAIFIVIGVCSITLLPVAIELGVELTRNSDGSSAVLWFLCALRFFTELPHQRLISFVRSANMLCIIFVLGQPRLFRLPHNVLALHLLTLFFFSPFLFYPSQCKVLSAPLPQRAHHRTCTPHSYSTVSGCPPSPRWFSSSKENRHDENGTSKCTRNEGQRIRNRSRWLDFLLHKSRRRKNELFGFHGRVSWSFAPASSIDYFMLCYTTALDNPCIYYVLLRYA
jgi:hypothetical protein